MTDLLFTLKDFDIIHAFLQSVHVYIQQPSTIREEKNNKRAVETDFVSLFIYLLAVKKEV